MKKIIPTATASVVDPSHNPNEVKEKKQYYGLQKSADYPGKSAAIRRSCTLAALIVSGYIKMNAGKEPVDDHTAGDWNLFTALTRGKANRVWSYAIVHSNDGKVKALNAMAQNTRSGYIGRLNIVAAFISGFRHGADIIADDKPKAKTEKVTFSKLEALY